MWEPLCMLVFLIVKLLTYRLSPMSIRKSSCPVANYNIVFPKTVKCIHEDWHSTIMNCIWLADALSQGLDNHAVICSGL